MKQILAAAFDNDCVITKGDMLHFISEKIGRKEEGDKWEHLYHERMFDAKTEEEREKAASEGLEGKCAPVVGLELAKLKEILQEIPLTAKANEALQLLHRKGVKIIVVSGTLLPIAKALAETHNLPIDYFICSDCEVREGKLGKLAYALTPKRKGERLAALLKELKINPENCFAIGDSISEKYMFELVGKERSIGFNCRPGLEKIVGHVIYGHGDKKRELGSVAELILRQPK